MTEIVKLIRRLAGVLGLTLVCAQPLPAQQSAGAGLQSLRNDIEMQSLRKDLEALREGQKGIQNDLQDIKKLLSGGRPAVQHQAVGAVVSIAGKPFKGDKDAKLTLIEISDYQCPFCARHDRETAPQIQTNYVANGKVKLVFQDLALPFHPFAVPAAEAAHCAGDQGKYWEMHDQLFENQKALAPTNLTTYATAIGLDMAKFQQCLDSGKYTTQVKEQGAAANKIGVTGSPSFVLGLTQPNDPDNIKVLKVLVGAVKFTAFQEAIDALLAAPPTPGGPAAAAPQPK